MQYTEEVNWSLNDFIVMGVLLLILGQAIDLSIRLIRKSSYQVTVIILIVVLFLLVWAELGVGLLGTPFAGS